MLLKAKGRIRRGYRTFVLPTNNGTNGGQSRPGAVLQALKPKTSWKRSGAIRGGITLRKYSRHSNNPIDYVLKFAQIPFSTASGPVDLRRVLAFPSGLINYVYW